MMILTYREHGPCMYACHPHSHTHTHIYIHFFSFSLSLFHNSRRRRYEKKLYQKRSAKMALERLDESIANDPEVQAALAECQ
jgi:hypothetical protein